MKKLCFLLALLLLLTGCGRNIDQADTHPSTAQTEVREDGLVLIDIYAVNDLHGKLVDGDNHPGVDEMTTYFKNAYTAQDNVILLSISLAMCMGIPILLQTAGLLLQVLTEKI